MRQRSVTDVSCEKYWRRESFFNKRKYSAAKKYSNPFPAACKCLFLFNFNIGTEIFTTVKGTRGILTLCKHFLKKQLSVKTNKVTETLINYLEDFKNMFVIMLLYIKRSS